jgi:hypothetical protein
MNNKLIIGVLVLTLGGLTPLSAQKAKKPIAQKRVSAIASDKNVTETVTTTTTNSKGQTQTSSVTTQNNKPLLAAGPIQNMPEQEIVDLFTTLDQVDGFIPNSQATINIVGDDAKGLIQLFTKDAPTKINCANKFMNFIFTSAGKTSAMIDVFLAKDCAYYLIKKEEKVYYHQMSQQGMNYFLQIYKEVHKGHNHAPGEGH